MNLIISTHTFPCLPLWLQLCVCERVEVYLCECVCGDYLRVGHYCSFLLSKSEEAGIWERDERGGGVENYWQSRGESVTKEERRTNRHRQGDRDGAWWAVREELLLPATVISDRSHTQTCTNPYKHTLWHKVTDWNGPIKRDWYWDISPLAVMGHCFTVRSDCSVTYVRSLDQDTSGKWNS